MKKQILSLLLAVLVLCTVSTGAFAASGVPEGGSITIKVRHDGEPIDGGELTLYKVGKIEENDGNYSFEPVLKLKDTDISLEDVDDPDLAEELADLAEEEGLEAISAPIEDGEAFFEDLDAGLYVVVQTETCPGFADMSPYLISVPQLEDGEWVTDVVARPKVPVEEEPDDPPPEEPDDPPGEPDDPPGEPDDPPDEPDDPPEEPDEPDEPTLPETGQLNWPVPLLAVSGLVMLLIGWALCFGGKKDGYEK